MILIKDNTHPAAIIIPRSTYTQYDYYSFTLENTTSKKDYRVTPLSIREERDYYRVVIDLGGLPEGEYTFDFTGNIVDTIYTGLLRSGDLKGERIDNNVRYKQKDEYISYGE